MASLSGNTIDTLKQCLVSDATSVCMVVIEC